jgi:tetratricopeptide (TPR) repeat protein
VLILATLGVGWIIWLAFTAQTAQSPAKRLLNVYILDVDTRKPVAANQVWTRELLVKWIYLPFLACVPPGFAIVVCGWAVFNKKRQTLYDKLLGTQVVYAPGAAESRKERGSDRALQASRGIDRLETEIGQAYEALSKANYGEARDQFSKHLKRARKLASKQQEERTRTALGRALEGRGLALLGLGDRNGAFTDLREATGYISLGPEAALLVGQVLLNQALAESAPARDSKLAEASRALDRCRQLDDGSALAHRDYGHCLLLMGDAAGAEAALERSVSLDDSDGMAWLALAKARQQLHRLPAGIEACLTAIERLPESTDAEELLGDLHFASEAWQDAINAYERVLTVAPERRAARRFHSLALYRLNRYEEAMPGLQETCSDSRDAMLALGRCNLQLNRFSEAIGIFRHLKDTQGEDGPSLYYLGCAYGHAGRLDEAKKSFERALAIEPGLERGYIGLGNAALALGLDSEAVDHFAQALKVGENQVDALLGLGTALVESESLDRAMECFQQVRALGHDGAATRGCGIVAEMRGDLDEAIGYYQEVGEPLRVGALLCLTGHFQEALSHLETAHAEGSEGDDVHYYLGKCLAELGIYEEAIRHLLLISRRSRSLEEFVGRVFWAQGLAFFRKEDPEAATHSWEQALNYLGDEPDCQQALASAYRRAAVGLLGQDTPRACHLLTRAEELDPGAAYLGALAKLNSGDVQEAIALLGPLAANSPEAGYHLGLAHLLAGQAQVAEKQLRPIVEQASLNGSNTRDAVTLLAAALAAQRRWGEAADLLLPALNETGRASGTREPAQIAAMHRDALIYLTKADRFEEAEGIIGNRTEMIAPGTIACLDAVKLAKQGQLGEAIDCLRKGVRTNGDAPALQNALSTLLCLSAVHKVQEGDIERACSQLLEAWDIARDPAVEEYLEDFHGTLATAYAESGQWGDLELLLERRARQNSHDMLTFHDLAVLQQSLALQAEDKAKFKKADEHWRAAHAYWGVMLASDEFWARWRQQCRLRYGAEVSAEDVRKVREDLPGCLLALHRGLRQACREKGRKKDARRHAEHEVSFLIEYSGAQAVQRGSALAERLKESVGPQFAVGMGAAQRLGLSDHVERLLEALQAVDENSPECVNLVKYFGPLGRPSVLVEVGRYAEAIERLEELLETEGNMARALRSEAESVYARACLGRSTELVDEKNISDAAKLLERALAITKNDELRERLVNLYVTWAEQLFENHKYPDTDVVFKRGLRHASGYQPLVQVGKNNLMAWGREAFAARDWLAAIARFEEAATLVRGDPEIRKLLAKSHYNQSLACYRAGDISGARHHVMKAMAYDPNDSDIQNWYARLMRR